MVRRGSVMAFDFGTRRIGVAVGDWETRLAHALTVIDAEDNNTRFTRIAGLIGEWQPLELVVGLPLSAEGEEHELTRRARRFANQLNGRYTLPVHLVDERYTSQDAEQTLREAGVKARERRQIEDSVAAKRILDDHFTHESALT